MCYLVATMKDSVYGVVLNRPRAVLLVLVAVLLLTGFVGEAAAHNPAGVAVPGCETGTDVVAHANPNCHGG